MRSVLRHRTRGLRRHQGTIREWLLLAAAIIAGVAGWTQIEDERDARKQSEAASVAAEERRQADEISSWIVDHSEGHATARISNASTQPVYSAVLAEALLDPDGRTSKLAQPYGHRVSVTVGPPGSYSVDLHPVPFSMGRHTTGIELAFRDQAGVSWVRGPDGRLKRLAADPVTYYHLTPPRTWQILRPIK
jgi:hypothetical protein